MKFLKQFNYPYLVEYSDKKDDLPKDQLLKLKEKLNNLISSFGTFKPLNLEDERIQQHTAFGMTQSFVSPMKEYITDEKL